MRIQIRKYASGYFNTPALPGRMFKSKDELVKMVIAQLPTPEEYTGEMMAAQAMEGIKKLLTIIGPEDRSQPNHIQLFNNRMREIVEHVRNAMYWPDERREHLDNAQNSFVKLEEAYRKDPNSSKILLRFAGELNRVMSALTPKTEKPEDRKSVV